MTDFHGTVELLEDDGTVIAEVVVFLRKEEATDQTLGSWAGHVEPDSVVPHIQAATIIRLSDGSEGAILVSHVNVAVDGPYDASQTATLVGSGPAPF